MLSIVCFVGRIWSGIQICYWNFEWRTHWYWRTGFYLLICFFFFVMKNFSILILLLLGSIDELNRCWVLRKVCLTPPCRICSSASSLVSRFSISKACRIKWAARHEQAAQGRESLTTSCVCVCVCACVGGWRGARDRSGTPARLQCGTPARRRQTVCASCCHGQARCLSRCWTFCLSGICYYWLWLFHIYI